MSLNEMREDQEEQIERPNSQDNESHSNTPPATRSYEAEGNIEYFDKIKEWIKLGSELKQDTLTEKLQPKEIERKDQGSQ